MGNGARCKKLHEDGVVLDLWGYGEASAVIGIVEDVGVAEVVRIVHDAGVAEAAKIVRAVGFVVGVVYAVVDFATEAEVFPSRVLKMCNAVVGASTQVAGRRMKRGGAKVKDTRSG